jgi:hypothetical protein
MFGGLLVGIVLCAGWHGAARSILALVVLWACTAFLVVLSIETVRYQLSIGTMLNALAISVAFVPHVLALGASIAGTIAASQRVPAHG